MSSELFTTSKEWPRRLLHVDVSKSRFRSIQRVGNDTYDGVSKPEYNILSYTWGRWEIPHGEALPIKNTTWKIPKVDKRGFSVQAFAKVVQHVRQKGTHVWLDVGCIDQENERVKASEIGRQASIFRLAREAYIWLSHSKVKTLKPFIIEALCRDAIDSEVNPFRTWLSHVHQGVQEIFSDPWFSSLWTLQEGYLRRDAILLFDDASTLDIPKFESYSKDGGPCTLLDIVSAYETIASNLRGVLQYDPERLGNHGTRLAREVCQRLHNVGVPCIAKSHAIALYEVSSFRNPAREHDRVYGIMQVFGLVLGKAAQPDKDFTLSELEDQLGDAVNKMNPVLAQSFVHLGDPRHNRRWCLQRNMRVFSDSPVVGRQLDQPDPWCEIVFDHSENLARFQGYLASLETLVASGLQFQTFYFDNTTEISNVLPEQLLQSEVRLSIHMDEVLGSSKPFEKVSILMIGGLDDGQSRRWLGIIVYRSLITPSSKRCWARIGVCTWSMHVDYMQSMLKRTFQEVSVLLN